MRITWNSQESRFEAELTSGPMWASDKDCLSAAKFSCSGPPIWTWFCTRSTALVALRENRPQSGLTITPEALERYTALKALEAANTEVKAQLDLAKKALRKEQKYQEQIAPPAEHEMEHGQDFDYNKVSDNKPVWFVPPVIPPPPTILCHVCRTPVYFYERQEPSPVCLDCEFPEDIR
jgi:hypothetical protein